MAARPHIASNASLPADGHRRQAGHIKRCESSDHIASNASHIKRVSAPHFFPIFACMKKLPIGVNFSVEQREVDEFAVEVLQD